MSQLVTLNVIDVKNHYWKYLAWLAIILIVQFYHVGFLLILIHVQGDSQNFAVFVNGLFPATSVNFYRCAGWKLIIIWHYFSAVLSKLLFTTFYTFNCAIYSAKGRISKVTVTNKALFSYCRAEPRAVRTSRHGTKITSYFQIESSPHPYLL